MGVASLGMGVASLGMGVASLGMGVASLRQVSLRAAWESLRYGLKVILRRSERSDSTSSE